MENADGKKMNIEVNISSIWMKSTWNLWREVKGVTSKNYVQWILDHSATNWSHLLQQMMFNTIDGIKVILNGAIEMG